MRHDAKKTTRSAITNRTSAEPQLRRRIAERAYQLYEMRGGSHGNDVEDWLRAEREVKETWRRRSTNGVSRTGTRKAA
jgi:hypothetical protein